MQMPSCTAGRNDDLQINSRFTKGNLVLFFVFCFLFICENPTRAARLSQCLMGDDRLLTGALACQVGSLVC